VAKELIALQPDVILAHSTASVAALQRETRTIPIVFVNVSDPIGLRFVASLARPGGNLTGVLHLEASIVSKWLAMLKEIAPGITNVALLGNRRATSFDYFLQFAQAEMPSLTIKMATSDVETAADIERSIETLARVPNIGLVLPPDSTTIAHRDLIIALAARHNLPAVYPLRLFVAAGSHVLRDGSERHVSAGWVVCRPHSARRQPSRTSGARTHQVRNSRKPQNGQGPRLNCAAGFASRRRRGD